MFRHKSFAMTVTAIICSAVFIAGCATPQPTSLTSNGQCVVLVHGLWRDASAMRPIANALRESGYYTVSFSYDSTDKPAPAVAMEDMQQAIAQCESYQPQKVHVVAHSLGSLVTRYYLQQQRLPGQGRVVMLSPPNNGSHLITNFENQPWMAWVAGAAVPTLSRNQQSVKELLPVQEQVGVIAGDKSRTLLPETYLPQPNDGTVALESTPLPGMSDYLVVNETHVTIRRAAVVHQQIQHFLANGTFQR